MSISHANVWRTGDDLLVTWRNGSPELSVFVSDDPDDAGVDVRAPDGPGQISISGVGDQRKYIHLFEPVNGFTVVAERRVPFDGPGNFRDIGGYVGLAGAVPWGRWYRADRLSALTDQDHRRLEALGIKTVVDLRSHAEVEADGDNLPAGISYEHHPLSSDVAQQRTMAQRIADGDLVSFGVDDMVAGYLRMVESFPDTFGRVLELAALGEPFVVHCTAGKDRTGLAAMLMLASRGVPTPDLLDDYHLTEQFRDPDAAGGFRAFVIEAGLDPDALETMWRAPRAVMKATIDGIIAQWGSLEDYVAAIIS